MRCEHVFKALSDVGSVNIAKHEVGQAIITVFQVLDMTWLEINLVYQLQKHIFNPLYDLTGWFQSCKMLYAA